MARINATPKVIRACMFIVVSVVKVTQRGVHNEYSSGSYKYQPTCYMKHVQILRTRRRWCRCRCWSCSLPPRVCETRTVRWFGCRNWARGFFFPTSTGAEDVVRRLCWRSILPIHRRSCRCCRTETKEERERGGQGEREREEENREKRDTQTNMSITLQQHQRHNTTTNKPPPTTPQ